MSSEFDNSFIEELYQRLNSPLPGTGAQSQMAASVRGSKSFDFGYGSPPVESSVLILLFRRNHKFYFPLIQRPEYAGVHGGQIGLPGGKQEPEDLNRIATALRETEEEIGVDLKDMRLLGSLSELYVRASNYNVLPVIGFIPDIPEYIPDPMEVSDVIECEIDQLLKDETVREKEITGRNGLQISAPYFAIDHHVVWGATAMILSEFKFILKEIFS
jgi:8-oxo-dGTP pyrophosphatase MutT (NUDIX family)